MEHTLELVTGFLRRVLRRSELTAAQDARRAAIHDLPIRPVDRGDGAPERSECPPILILSWEAYDEWLAEHGGDAA